MRAFKVFSVYIHFTWIGTGIFKKIKYPVPFTWKFCSTEDLQSKISIIPGTLKVFSTAIPTTWKYIVLCKWAGTNHFQSLQYPGDLALLHTIHLEGKNCIYTIHRQHLIWTWNFQVKGMGYLIFLSIPVYFQVKCI